MIRERQHWHGQTDRHGSVRWCPLGVCDSHWHSIETTTIVFIVKMSEETTLRIHSRHSQSYTHTRVPFFFFSFNCFGASVRTMSHP